MPERKFVKNKVKGKQRGSKYPSKTKEQALADMALGKSLRDIEKRLSVPYSTLKSWERSALLPPKDKTESELATAREKNRLDIIAKSYKAAHLTLDFNISKLSGGEDVNFNDAAAFYSLLIDKLQLMENRPTAITKNDSELDVRGAISNLSTEDLKRLAAMKVTDE